MLESLFLSHRYRRWFLITSHIRGINWELEPKYPVSRDGINPPKAIFFILLSASQICSSSVTYPSHHPSKYPSVSPSSHHPLVPFYPDSKRHPSSSHLAASSSVVATCPIPPAPRDTATRVRARCPPYLGLSKGSHGAAARPLLAPPRPPSRRRHLCAPGQGDCAEPALGAGSGCCGADAPPPPSLFALRSEGAPGRPAPAGHVVPPPPPPATAPRAPPLPATSLTCLPQCSSPESRFAASTSPHPVPPTPCRVSLPLRTLTRRGQARFGTSASGRGPTPSLGHLVSGLKAVQVGWKSWEKMRHHSEPKWRRGKFFLAAPPCVQLPTITSRERDRAGPPSPWPQPSQCCRADTASGFRDHRGRNSRWGTCIRRSLDCQHSAAGKDRGIGEPGCSGPKQPFLRLRPQPPVTEPRHRAIGGTLPLNSEGQVQGTSPLPSSSVHLCLKFLINFE